MNTKLAIVLLIATTSSLIGLNGCASLDAPNQRSLLAAAGFRVKTPQTARQQELFAQLTPYRVHRATAKGKVFYIFKDERNGVAYVGGEAEYQRYQQLAIQQQIARDNYMAAAMNRDAAWGWYGAWGPGAFWW